METVVQLLSTALSWAIYGFLGAWVLGAVAALGMMWTGRRQQVRELLRRYSLAVSILSVAALMVCVQAGFGAVNIYTTPPYVPLPPKRFLEANLPKASLGDWRGQVQPLDEKSDKIFVSTESHDAVSLSLRDGSGYTTSLFVALYKDPAIGVYHTPFNCYRSQGWTQVSPAKRIPLKIDDRSQIPEIEVSLSTWARRDQRILVMFWYQAGEQVLYERGWDVLRFRWSHGGQSEWPPTFKVLMQVDGKDPTRAEARLLDLGQQVRKWIADLPEGWNQ